MDNSASFSARLAAAWQIAGHLGLEAERPVITDRANAYHLQDDMAAAPGETPVGRKVDATSAKGVDRGQQVIAVRRSAERPRA